MKGSSRSRNGEQMIGTRGKIDAGRGIDSFWSEEPTERSRDDKTAEDARRRHKMTHTGGKGPNNQWAHAKYIENPVNK